jgi:CDP-diacylglycerol--glycerol-3-phosphate 3-phosphatidyltransferase
VNLPTQLTVGRICLVPLVVAFLISNESTHALVAAVLFVGAALTDWLDGLIARRRGQVTTLGKLLDPVADKVLVSAALISLVQVGTVEAWMVVIVIGREFAVTGLRSVSAAQGLVIEASDLGKYKTFSQYLAVTLLILERSVPSGFDSEFVYVSRGMLWAALTLTVFSGIDYFVRFYRASDVDALIRGEDRGAERVWPRRLSGRRHPGRLRGRAHPGIDIRQRQRQHRRDQRAPHRGLDASRGHAPR